MRIVHLLQSNKFSGAESVVCQIIDMFRNEPDYEMVYVSPEGPIRSSLQNRDIRYYALQQFDNRNIKQAINELKPDVIHAHDFNASVRAAMQKKIKIISHLHSNPKWLSELCFNSVVYCCCAHRFGAIVGVSEAILKEYCFSKHIQKKFVCLPNAVDIGNVVTKSDEEYIQPIDALFVGRLSKPKNPLLFLEIVKGIKEKCDSINAIMIGVGPLKEQCEQYIRDNALETTVKMIGFESNPFKYIKASKMVVIPSTFEGFGLVAVESMALGTVVLASPVGGLVDILGDNCGYLCSSVTEFIDKAVEILSCDNDCADVIENAKRKALEFSNLEEYKSTIKVLYDSVWRKNNG